jgi:hypothetical protein
MEHYELVEFVEPAFGEGAHFRGTDSQVLGVYDTEAEAVTDGRTRWSAFRESGSIDIAWWIVRVPGEDLARWIADGASPTERVLDLSTNTLVEVH